MIPAAILASGLSTRMGQPKALLTVADSEQTFVDQLVRTMLEGGASDVLVIGRPEDHQLQAAVDRLGTRCRFVVNTRAYTGQLSSVIAGVNAADHPGTRGVLVTPVDLPLIAASTVAALIAAFDTSGAPIVRATHGGKHGHPVIFGRAVFDELRHADPSVGAKAVVHAHAAEVLDVPVDDPGVLFDVDDPQDYARLLERIRHP